jgi:DNA invertase Pin-like site-specific DNA recombinase
MDGKFIAYYRVSTDRQGMNGNGMAAQRKAVEDYLNGGRWKLVGEFTEVESGKRSDRPELEKALTACRKHKAKLVIAKLDRLSGNVHFISGLMERKVDFVACDMPSANAFMINVYAAVAQEERRMISDHVAQPAPWLAVVAKDSVCSSRNGAGGQRSPGLGGRWRGPCFQSGLF